LPAPYNTGDPDNGQAKFALCQACHTVTAGGPNMTGPNLHGIFGRKAATLPGYTYSDAMKGAGWTWDAQHLDAWLAGPTKVLPGTKMTFVGLPNPKDRIDVIAYLKIASGS
jgi:cytochrome c